VRLAREFCGLFAFDLQLPGGAAADGGELAGHHVPGGKHAVDDAEAA
jgi:hypothetical protein